MSPTPHGVGGLKWVGFARYTQKVGPTPHGVGGLKYIALLAAVVARESHPAWGGWIEILLVEECPPIMGVPPRMGWVD